MYIWRFPLPLFGVLVAGTGLALTWIAVASLRRRVKTIVARGLLLSVAVVAALLSPVVVHAIVADELEKMARLGVYAHYSPYIFLAPAVLVAALFGIRRVAFPRGEANLAHRWNLSFWLIAFAFTALNIVNWCSPGWCEHFGFPFPYSWWSDAILILNGENFSAGRSVIAFLANAMVFLAVVAVLSRSYRRSLRST